MSLAIVADTGGLLRALAARPDGTPTWPQYSEALSAATRVVVPSVVLAEVDYFLRAERKAMRRLVAEIFDPQTTYEYDAVSPYDIVRALEIDAKFRELHVGLVDGVVAAVAEKRQIRHVLTIDRAHFTVMRIGRRYEKSLILVP